MRSGAFLLVALIVGCWGCDEVIAGAANGSAGCERAAIDAGRRLERSLEVEGGKRLYLLDVPPTVVAGKPVPLLFDFHGWGHSAAGVWEVSRFKDIAARESFITVYPEGLPISLLGREARPGWEIRSVDGNRDLRFVDAMLAEIEASYCIDRERVFATGFSNGAYLSHLLGCVRSERFAAIAPVGGGDVTVACAPARPVPVLIHHGSSDEVIPIAQARQARDGWAARHGCGAAETEGNCARYRDCRADVVYCEEDVAHTWPVAATERIWRFFSEVR